MLVCFPRTLKLDRGLMLLFTGWRESIFFFRKVKIFLRGITIFFRLVIAKAEADFTALAAESKRRLFARVLEKRIIPIEGGRLYVQFRAYGADVSLHLGLKDVDGTRFQELSLSSARKISDLMSEYISMCIGQVGPVRSMSLSRLEEACDALQPAGVGLEEEIRVPFTNENHISFKVIHSGVGSFVLRLNIEGSDEYRYRKIGIASAQELKSVMKQFAKLAGKSP